MATVIFVEHGGEQHQVEVEQGKSLMEAAVENGVPGIDADCGGACACGTCHVIVDPEWLAKTGSLSDEEESMLGMTPDRQQTSRLSCQITASEALDGIVVRLPEFQM